MTLTNWLDRTYNDQVNCLNTQFILGECTPVDTRVPGLILYNSKNGKKKMHLSHILHF